MPWLRRRGYRNDAEQQFFEWALNKGWEPTKRGWPDFLCRLPDGGFIAVEVKRDDWPNLKPEQRIVCRLLQSLGLQTVLWTPTGGLQEIPKEPQP